MTRRNLGNGLLLLAAAVPPVLLARVTAIGCDPHESELCARGTVHPILTMNAIFSVCMIGFWIVSIVQRSTWLIDPYWTIIPPMIGHFFAAHPASVASERGWLALGLVWLWAVRLTYNYFRRERWQLGAREDWRFAEMRRKNPKHFWWMAFFAAFLSQQLMLAGLCLPLWAVFAEATPLGVLDVVAAAGCVAGIVIAHVADTQLAAFMRENETRVASGQPKVLILDRGLFGLARHPNYFGEQLFWWSLALFGLAAGHAWVVIGTLFNTLVMVRVTQMTDRRMAERPERAEAYAAYRARTRSWIPLPKRS